MAPNPNTQSGQSPAELMFSRRVQSIFDKLLPGRKITFWKNTKQTSNRYFRPRDGIFFFFFFFWRGLYISGKEMCKVGVIITNLEKTSYMIQGLNWRYKRHVNQLKRRFTNQENVQTHLPMEILCDAFNLPKTQVIKP